MDETIKKIDYAIQFIENIRFILVTARDMFVSLNKSKQPKKRGARDATKDS